MAADIDATIDRLHAEGATDEEITGIIKEKYGKPFDVNAQNATMRQNMTAQDAAASRPPASEFTLSKIGERAGAGLKGEVEGAAGGLLGLASLPMVGLSAIRHPMDTAKALGVGAVMAGGAAKHAYDNPGDTWSAATDAATRFATDPEKIGALAGGTGVALAAPALTRAAASTRLGQAATVGLSSAANRIPGIKEARTAWAASAPIAPAAPTAAADAIQPMKASDFLSSLQEMAPADRQAAMAARTAAVKETAESPLEVTRRMRAENRAATSPEAAERVPHPALARTNPAAAPAIEPMASHPPNVADANVSTPLGDPRVTNVNPKYPWSPEQTSQIRLGMSDWHSGAPSGTPAARAGQNLHIEDHMLDQRYRQLLADPKKALLLPMLAPLLRKALMDQMQGQDTQSNQGTQ